MTLRNYIATKACLALALLLIGDEACAGPIGVVTDLSGPLLVKTLSGSIKVLAIDSPVEQGQILSTRKDTYAQLTLSDHSSVTLGPNTELTIEKYSFHETTPQNDVALISLNRGQVRIAAGVLGTRDTDSFTLTAASTAIDIRGATLVAEYIMRTGAGIAWSHVGPPEQAASEKRAIGHTTGQYRSVRMLSFGTQAPLRFALSDAIELSDRPVPASAANTSGRLQIALNIPVPGQHAPGLYVQVLDGLIHVSNGGGTQSFSAGQFGFVPSITQPPVVLPANPGMQFTPPPSFSSTVVPGSGSNATKSANVDCEVR
ncbi:MAG: iron dicitrate transport regulator FecR [Gammaproteobacteria bacterium]|nr:iron dicitrate transport regulator FecR [Gammaproteobacteria bacterium]